MIRYNAGHTIVDYVGSEICPGNCELSSCMHFVERSRTTRLRVAYKRLDDVDTLQ